MPRETTIEWTDYTWNPVTGCSKISEGCRHCYAERMAMRLKAMGAARYANGFKLTPHEDLIDLPRRLHRARKIFVNSMSDLFHENLAFDFVRRVFETMAACTQHTFQVLTKRSDRLREFAADLSWPENVWMGVTVENADALHRIEDLQHVAAKVRFVSLEPLLGPLDGMDLTGIDWAIVGGESGPFARPMQEQWALDIRDKCLAHSTAFFFKQWGGTNKKKAGRVLQGRTWDESPNVARLVG